MLKQLLFLSIIFSPIFAQSPLDVDGVDHQIVFWAFNHQFEPAEKLTDEKIAENPAVQKYYFLKIVTASLKHLADSDKYNYEKRYEYRQQKNKELIAYTEEVIEKVEDAKTTPENKYYLANLHGYLGRMYGFERSYMSAFSNAKKGKDLLEELVEKYPDIYDAYLLLGMFEYYADRLGGVTEFIAGILGFSGDRTRGLEYMKLAQQKGELTRPFAEFILGETYFTQEDNPFEAYGYFNILIKKYPNNKDFYDWCVRILLQLNRLNDAEELIEKDDKNFVTGYTRSSFLIKNGEFGKAVPLLTDLIERKDFKWRGAYQHSKFLRAEASLLIDKPIENVEDELEPEQLRIYNELKNNLEAAKMVYDFVSTVGKLRSGVKIEIPELSSFPQNGFLQSMYDYYTGVYYYKLRDGTNAVKFFTKVAKSKKHFNKDAVEYLINIFKSFKPTERQLDELEDTIDDLDDDDLEFSFMDLRE